MNFPAWIVSLFPLIASTLDPQYSLKAVFGHPQDQGCSQVQYVLEKELVLQPNETAYFTIPQGLRNKAITFATLGHRPDPKTQRGRATKTEWDEWPGHTSLQLWSEADHHWHYWAGHASGKFGAKFAEVRNSPEQEGFYDWGKIGHWAISENKALSRAPLHADFFRLVSLGLDPVYIKNVGIKVMPHMGTQESIVIFSPGTEFGHPFTFNGTHFGGGQKFKGTFPNAFMLNPRERHFEHPKKLPEGWSQPVGGTLAFLPKPGSKIYETQIAIGDSKPNEIKNDDGGWGSHGGSLLNVIYRHADGREEYWMRNENVPPEGILRAAPHDCGITVEEGDQIIYRVSKDTAYLMGARVAQ